MRGVVEKIGGREVVLKLDLDALDRIAAVNAQFAELVAALHTSQFWDWREVVVVVSEALRPHNINFNSVFEERGVQGCVSLAARVMAASLPVPEADEGNAPAVAETKAPMTDGSGSGDSSAAA